MLRSTGALAAAGFIAGCSGDGGSEDGSTETDEQTAEGGDESSGVSQDITDYLDDTSNFEDSVTDMTGEGPVTVEVGVEANGGNFGYSPAAVTISTGTTVEFEWTGQGAGHNVISEGDGPLDSGSAVDTEGVEYEYTFEEAGTYLYKCVPHEGLGMKGAIVVE